MRRWGKGSPRIVGLHDPQVNEHHLTQSGLPEDGRLRLLSFNIQVGISTERYRHYLTRSWQHLLPHVGRAGNLQKIGDLINDFDLVALQEVDGGSMRSGFVNQVEHLAQLGSFPFWYQQLNRNLGRFAQHSNGVLSRLRPTRIEDHPLPGPAGRGAILVRFGEGEDALVVVMMHLALGTRTRTRQLAYIRELI
ncbi:endonuclease/exonuclease/phosphatase family protein, partial [Pseudomonas syringae pv. actinidiae ICMP 19096]